MKNIGVVTTWLPRGASYVSKQFADVISSQGNNVFIYARGGEFFDDISNGILDISYDRSPYSYIPTDIEKSNFEKWIEANKIEAIIFNEQQYWQPVKWAKNKGIKCICYVDYYTNETVDLFGIYDQIWCNTKRHYKVFKKFSQAKYLPWGTDLDLYKPTTKDDNLVFFHSAGMNPYRKGTDILLKSLDEISDEVIASDAKFVIHSQRKIDISNLKNIKKLILKKKIDILVKTIDPPGFFPNAHYYVYPSRLDGLGLTIAEAVASGCNIITTNEEPMIEFTNNEFADLINVKKRFKRNDGYYWSMVEPDHKHLSEILLNKITSKKTDQSCHIPRRYAEQNLCFKDNMMSLKTFLNEQVSSIANYDLIDNYDKKKYPILPFHIFFRTIFSITYKVYRYFK